MRRVPRSSFAALIAIWLLAAGPGVGQVRAQASAPLTKTELVRVISSGAYSPAEAVLMIRNSCLSFEPTASDLADLRALGASDAIIDAVSACGRSSLSVTLSADRVTVFAGESGWIQATARRGDSPVPGLRLQLTGSPATGGRPIVSQTDSRGQASFSIPAGRSTGAFRLVLRALGVELADPPALNVRVVPGPPVAARLSPAYVVIDPTRDTTIVVRATLTDGFGNAVVGQSVSLTAATGRTELAGGVTDEDGTAELRARSATLPSGAVSVNAGSSELAELVVEHRILASSDAAEADARESEANSGESAGERGAPRQPSTEDPEGESADEEPGAGIDMAALDDDAAVADSLALYRSAVTRRPEDPALRLGLARQLADRGELVEAERQFVESLRLSPDPRENPAGSELARLRLSPVRIQAEVLGGLTIHSDPGVRAGEISIRLIPALRVWGRYDRSLGLDPVPLVRGPDEMDGVFAGAELGWGDDRRFVTSIEAGRRTFPSVPFRPSDATDASELTADAHENVVRLEQTVVLSTATSAGSVKGGGYLGRWYDRDDLLIYLEARIPVIDRVTVAPMVVVGETIGSVPDAATRTARREIRAHLPLSYRTRAGLLLEPAVAIGRITTAGADPDRTLVEPRLLIELPISGPHRIRIFGRHQMLSGQDPVTIVAAGLQIRLR